MNQRTPYLHLEELFAFHPGGTRRLPWCGWPGRCTLVRMHEHEIVAVDLPYEVEQIVFGHRTLCVRPRDPHILYELADDGTLTPLASVPEGESLQLFTADDDYAAVAWFAGKDECQLALVLLDTGRIRPMMTLGSQQHASWAAPFHGGLAVRHRMGLDDVLTVIDVTTQFVFRSGRLADATPIVAGELIWVEDFTTVLSSDERTDGSWTVREETHGDARECLGRLGPGEEEPAYTPVPPGVTAIAAAASVVYLATQQDTWDDREAAIWTVHGDEVTLERAGLPIHMTRSLAVAHGSLYGLRPNGSLGCPAVWEFVDGDAIVVEEIAESLSKLDSLTAIPGGVRWFESTQAWVFGEPAEGTFEQACIVTATRGSELSSGGQKTKVGGV